MKPNQNTEISEVLKGHVDPLTTASGHQADYIKALEDVAEVAKELNDRIVCQFCAENLGWFLSGASEHVDDCKFGKALKRLEEVKKQEPKHHHCSCVHNALEEKG